MHAERVERDRPGDDQLVVAVVGAERWSPGTAVASAAPSRRRRPGCGVSSSASRVDVGAERPEQLSCRALHGITVDTARLSVGVGRLCQSKRGDAMIVHGHVRFASAGARVLTS